MSKRTTFSDLKKGDKVEIRKNADEKGIIKEVNDVSKGKYGTKISLGYNFKFVVDNEQALFVTEFFDSRQKYVYIIDQQKAAK